jgi:integrase
MIQEICNRYILELQHKNPATLSQLRKVSAYYRSDQEVTPTRIMDYVISRRISGAAPSTINRELTILKQLFKWAKIRGYIEQDPTEGIRFETGVAKRIRHITVEEEKRLMEESAIWLQPIIQFATSTGMRRGEILNLEKSDINLEDCTAVVRESKNGQPRTIPLTRRALEAVSSAMSVNEKVFGGKNGEWLVMSNFEYNFKAASKRAGLVDLHFHDMRHTCFTRLVQNGVDLYVIQCLAGHKSPAMTQRYAHHSIESLRKAIEHNGN